MFDCKSCGASRYVASGFGAGWYGAGWGSAAGCASSKCVNNCSVFDSISKKSRLIICLASTCL